MPKIFHNNIINLFLINQAPSYRSAATSDPGAVAALAESRKMSKYSALDSTLYRFFPIAIETMGAFGSRSLRFTSKILGDELPYTLRRSIGYLSFCSTSLGCHSAG